MEWNKESIEEFLSTQKERSIDINEYMLLIDFINEIRPDIIIDIGTYLGHSGYILGTCCDSIKNIISIENIDSEEHGKYLPRDAVFLTKGYENGVFNDLIKEHPNAFVFWDAGKNTIKVLRQIILSHKNNVKYIALHDSGNKQRTVRRAINRAVDLGWYKILKEDIDSCLSKGITIMERIE